MSFYSILTIRATLRTHGMEAAVRQARAHGLRHPHDFIAFILGKPARIRAAA